MIGRNVSRKSYLPTPKFHKHLENGKAAGVNKGTHDPENNIS